MKPRKNETREHAELGGEKDGDDTLLNAVTITLYHTLQIERDSFESNEHALVAAC